MGQPTPYNRLKDFTQYALDHTSAPYNASDHDAEFDAVELTLDGLCANIALIQRNDGALRNQTVHPDSLTTATKALIGAGRGNNGGAAWTPRGLWVTATDYDVGDVVEQGGRSYVCAVDHTSGTFSTDRTAGKWVIIDSTDGSVSYFAVATGTGDAMVVDLPVTALSDGFEFRTRAPGANTVAAPTVEVGGATVTITKHGGSALTAGDYSIGSELTLRYRASTDKFEIIAFKAASLAELAASGGSALIGHVSSGTGLSSTDVATQLKKAEFLESIAALKAWSGPTNKTVAFVRGYYAAGDGGGGLYYYDSSSSATDNGGTIITPTAAPAIGRWLRQYDAQQYSVKVFGAKGDAATDDFAAIDSCMTAVAAISVGSSIGGKVTLPEGQYVVTEQVVVPNKVRLCGAGKRATFIIAKNTFATSTPVVRLGDGTSFVFDCRLEDLAIDCNSVSGCGGVYSTDANEGSGLRHVLVNNNMGIGVDLDDTGASNYNNHWLLDDVEIFAASTATGTIGFHYKGNKAGGQIRRISCSNNGTTTQLAGMKIEGATAAGGHVFILGAGFERYTDGLLIEQFGSVTADSVNLQIAGTNTVRIATSTTANPVVLRNIQKGASTNTIKNDVISHSVTDTRVPVYITSDPTAAYQVWHLNSQGNTEGNLISNSLPAFRIKSTVTSGNAQQSAVDFLDGNNNGWRIRHGANASGQPFQLCPISTGTVGSQVFGVTSAGAIRNLVTSNGPVGTVTLTASAATTTVSNTAVTGSSIIFLFPTSANAAADVAAGVYISAKVNGTSFTITHANNANADKTFNYLILN